MRSRPVGALALCSLANVAMASMITISGAISQSTPDGTGPAVNNPALNNTQDGQAFTVTLNFAGAIGGPGTYNLMSVVFSVPAASATEASFGAKTLTVTADGSFFDLSLLGCLTTGGGCGAGNQLDANFKILAASLNLQNVAAIGLDPPHPLDLLEDDSTTDIQGSISRYSYIGSLSAAPEPSTMALVGCVLAALRWKSRRSKSKEEEI